MYKPKGADADAIALWDKYILDQSYLMKCEPCKPVSAYFIDTFGSADILEKVGFTKEEVKLLLKADRYDLKNMIESIKNGVYTAQDVMTALNKTIKKQGDQPDMLSALEEAINNIEIRIANKISEDENIEQHFTRVSNHTVYV